MMEHGHADFDTLVRYWLGELEANAEADLEEHLLGCDRCGSELDEVVALAGAVREAFAQGALHAFVPESFVQRLAAQGTRMSQYRVAPGGSVNCALFPGDRFVVARMQAPLERVARVDAIVDVEGEVEAYRDIPFDAASGEVVLLPRPASLRARPFHRARFRLVAVDAAGERELGTYTFNHTQSMA